MKGQNPIRIAGVVPDSPAMAYGITGGDRLLSVNGILPRDTIEYSYLACGDSVRLKIHQGRRTRTILVRKNIDANLGLLFDNDCFNGIKRCRNHCLFCFVDQLPPGMRHALYQKDDDYRLSFLHGNFLTLTNTDDQEIQRIITLHLSPLYLSVHATDPSIRGFMLGQTDPVPILDRIAQLAGGNIAMHIQVVLCPGLNDGVALKQTIDDLTEFWPQVVSVGVVPVGLTKFRSNRPKIRAFTKVECIRLVRTVAALQEQFRRKLGASFVYPADEFYLRAQMAFPAASRYDQFPQLENGIGNGRLFHEEFRRLLPELPDNLRQRRRFCLATGEAGATVLEPVIHRLKRINNLEISMVPIKNTYFGPRISVTGLLTGKDLVRGLRGRQGEEVLLPNVVLRQNSFLLLDGMSLDQVALKTGCHLRVLQPTADALIFELLKSDNHLKREEAGRIWQNR